MMVEQYKSSFGPPDTVTKEIFRVIMNKLLRTVYP